MKKLFLILFLLFITACEENGDKPRCQAFSFTDSRAETVIVDFIESETKEICTLSYSALFEESSVLCEEIVIDDYLGIEVYGEVLNNSEMAIKQVRLDTGLVIDLVMGLTPEELEAAINSINEKYFPKVTGVVSLKQDLSVLNYTESRV